MRSIRAAVSRHVTILTALALVVVVVVPAGCFGPRPTLEGARALAESFMRNRLDGLTEQARGALSAKGQAAYGPNSGLVLDLAGQGDITGYFLLAETIEKAGHYRFTYRIHRVGEDIPYAMFWDEVLTVLGRRDTYTIDDAAQQPGQECFVREDLAVYLCSEGQEHRLFGMDDLPDDWVPPGMPPDFGFGIGKEGYVLLSFSPIGDRVAFVTWGTHGFLGVFDVAAGRVEGLDLHWEGVAVEVRWSPTGLLLAAVIDAPTGNKALYIYDTATQRRLALGLETHFPPGEFGLDHPRWSTAGTVSFTVRASEGTSATDGIWQVNVQTGEVRKLAGL